MWLLSGINIVYNLKRFKVNIFKEILSDFLKEKDKIQEYLQKVIIVE